VKRETQLRSSITAALRSPGPSIRTRLSVGTPSVLLRTPGLRSQDRVARRELGDVRGFLQVCVAGAEEQWFVKKVSTVP